MRALGACAFVAPPARTLKWSFFTPEQGGSEKAVLTAERTLTARCLLGMVFGQRNAIGFLSLYCFSWTHSCARMWLEFDRPVLFHLFKVIASFLSFVFVPTGTFASVAVSFLHFQRAVNGCVCHDLDTLAWPVPAQLGGEPCAGLLDSPLLQASEVPDVIGASCAQDLRRLPARHAKPGTGRVLRHGPGA